MNTNINPFTGVFRPEGKVYPDTFTSGYWWTKAKCQCCGAVEKLNLHMNSEEPITLANSSRIERRVMEAFIVEINKRKCKNPVCPSNDIHKPIDIAETWAAIADHLECDDKIVQNQLKVFAKDPTEVNAQRLLIDILGALFYHSIITESTLRNFKPKGANHETPNSDTGSNTDIYVADSMCDAVMPRTGTGYKQLLPTIPRKEGGGNH